MLVVTSILNDIVSLPIDCTKSCPISEQKHPQIIYYTTGKLSWYFVTSCIPKPETMPLLAREVIAYMCTHKYPMLVRRETGSGRIPKSDEQKDGWERRCFFSNNKYLFCYCAGFTTVVVHMLMLHLIQIISMGEGFTD